MPVGTFSAEEWEEFGCDADQCAHWEALGIFNPSLAADLRQIVVMYRDVQIGEIAQHQWSPNR
jgi:hypothetical protein